MPRIFSAKLVIKILCRDYGFYFASQKGSHVKLRKDNMGRKIITIIPLHKELSPGTLKGVLELAEINEEDFLKKM
ncbi:type II toxin-antitoxin system HicA family toxin [Patescibacteria group bacterium]|nr:type II toxin-antitoxin system HicA family toxin [Patescibacteria group bacterium]